MSLTKPENNTVNTFLNILIKTDFINKNLVWVRRMKLLSLELFKKMQF